MHSLRLIVSVLLVTISAGIHASDGVYKWVDDEGNVHFGAKPPEDSNAESILAPKEKPTVDHTIESTAISAEVFHKGGVTQIIPVVGKGIVSQHSPFGVSRLANGKLWFALERHILELNLDNTEARLHGLERIPEKMFAQSVKVVDDVLIFHEQGTELRKSKIHLYDLNSDTYRAISLRTQYLVNTVYVDRYRDGLFYFDYLEKTLHQYPIFNRFISSDNLNVTSYKVDQDTAQLYLIATTPDKIWFLFKKHKTYKNNNCAVGFINKRNGQFIHFDHDEMGNMKPNHCVQIVADENEVWIASIHKGRETLFLVYDINRKQWKSLLGSVDGTELNFSYLELDKNHLYYVNCSKITAIDRKTLKAVTLDTNDFNPTAPRSKCVGSINLHKNNLWAHSFTKYNRRQNPVFYRIPLDKFSRPIE